MPPTTSTSPRPSAAEPSSGLLADLEAAWERSDAIFGLVRGEALGERPIALRNPLLFYVGHLPAFAWNLMMRGVLERGDSSRPAFDRAFDFGIDPEEASETPPEPDWPPLDEVLRYRDEVRAAIRDGADELEERAADDPLAANARILHVVLEHEVMHHETLLYMLQELSREHLRRAPWWNEPTTGASHSLSGTVSVPGGEVALGVDFDAAPFGWDNEFPERRVHVEPFELDVAPVTLADWLGFVEAGGYRDRSLWDERALAWLGRNDVRSPKDWLRRDGRWFVRGLFDDVPLDEVAAWPVCVSWAEADAWARWKGRRLPSEPELFRAAYGSRPERPFPWKGDEALPRHGNFDLAHHSPTPLGLHPAGVSPFGVHELVGNGWEWTSSPWEEHEGFRAYMQGYPGYSADFFDGAHYAIFGASWATGARLLRRSFRNWFRFNYPFPFTKLRTAADA